MQVGIFIPPEDNNGFDREIPYFLEQLIATCVDIQSQVQFTQFQCPGASFSINGCKQFPLAPNRLDGLLRRDPHGLKRAVKETGVEVLVAPMTQRLRVQAPLFLCVLDLAAWEQAPNDDPAPLKPQNVKRWKQYCLQANRILAPSNYVQRRFLDYFECPMDKMLISPLGVDPAFETPSQTIAEQPYIVVYADSRTRALMNRVRAALEIIAEQYPHQVIVVGPGYPEEPANWGDRVLRVEQCPATLLAGLYQHCDAFVYAGLHDGSAMRVLEAIRAQIPVIAAQSGALSEVVGDIPLYFNPGSTNAIIKALRQVLDDPEAHLVTRHHKTRKLMEKHQWETCAWKFLGALKQIAVS